MLISTWNVNGIRSASKAGLQAWLDEIGPDIVCLQETKFEPDLLSRNWFAGYQLEIFPAEKRGYAGTAVLFRKELSIISLRPGIGHERFDREGRVLTVEFEGYEVVCIYAPHSHRKLINLEKKKDFMISFLKYVEDRLASRTRKPLVLAGDFNVAFDKRDVFHHSSNKGNAGFHDDERELFGQLMKLGFVDALRQVDQEAGTYSWWSLLPGVRERNVGWRLDYILVETSIRENIVDCFHSVHARGSDHCPVTVRLNG